MVNGRPVHSQGITENVTEIYAADWPSGIYIWKVIKDGSEAESGKWVKK